MKKILLLTLLFMSQLVLARTPESIGRLFANVVVCHQVESFNDLQKSTIEANIYNYYHVAAKGAGWQNLLQRGKKKELARLHGLGVLERAMMCSSIAKKWNTNPKNPFDNSTSTSSTQPKDKKDPAVWPY